MLPTPGSEGIISRSAGSEPAISPGLSWRQVEDDRRHTAAYCTGHTVTPSPAVLSGMISRYARQHLDDVLDRGDGHRILLMDLPVGTGITDMSSSDAGTRVSPEAKMVPVPNHRGTAALGDNTGPIKATTIAVPRQSAYDEESPLRSA